MNATLRKRGWLFREWVVTTPTGDHTVSYSGGGYGYESVRVNGVIAVKTRSVIWFVPKFEFKVAGLPATVEVCVRPWLTIGAIRLHVGDEVCYSEGF